VAPRGVIRRYPRSSEESLSWASGARDEFRHPVTSEAVVGSVIKKRRKRMAKKKHRKLLRKTRVQRRNKK
jgi:hypothetical protein